MFYHTWGIRKKSTIWYSFILLVIFKSGWNYSHTSNNHFQVECRGADCSGYPRNPSPSWIRSIASQLKSYMILTHSWRHWSISIDGRVTGNRDTSDSPLRTRLDDSTYCGLWQRTWIAEVKRENWAVANQREYNDKWHSHPYLAGVPRLSRVGGSRPLTRNQRYFHSLNSNWTVDHTMIILLLNLLQIHLCFLVTIWSRWLKQSIQCDRMALNQSRKQILGSSWEHYLKLRRSSRMQLSSLDPILSESNSEALSTFQKLGRPD